MSRDELDLARERRAVRQFRWVHLLLLVVIVALALWTMTLDDDKAAEGDGSTLPRPSRPPSAPPDLDRNAVHDIRLRGEARSMDAVFYYSNGAITRASLVNPNEEPMVIARLARPTSLVALPGGHVLLTAGGSAYQLDPEGRELIPDGRADVAVGDAGTGRAWFARGTDLRTPTGYESLLPDGAATSVDLPAGFVVQGALAEAVVGLLDTQLVVVDMEGNVVERLGRAGKARFVAARERRVAWRDTACTSVCGVNVTDVDSGDTSVAFVDDDLFENGVSGRNDFAAVGRTGPRHRLDVVAYDLSYAHAVPGSEGFALSAGFASTGDVAFVGANGWVHVHASGGPTFRATVQLPADALVLTACYC